MKTDTGDKANQWVNRRATSGWVHKQELGGGQQLIQKKFQEKLA